MEQKLLVALSQRPGLAGQGRHHLAEGQIEALDEGGIDQVGEGHLLQRLA